MPARFWWSFGLLIATASAAQGQTVMFPPLVPGAAMPGTVYVPRCEVAGRRMNCQLLTLTVTPNVGQEGRCHVHLFSETFNFTRQDADTWVGERTHPKCRAKTSYRLSQGTGAPKRLVLRLTYEIGDKSAECREAFSELGKDRDSVSVELTWTEGKDGALIPLSMPNCSSYATGPGNFPADAFGR